MAGVLPAESRTREASAPPKRNGLKVGLAVGGLVVVLGVGGRLALPALLGGPETSASGIGETARASRDRLVVTISESGEVEAKDSVDIKCEVEEGSTVIWLIEEGTLVKAGDKLAQLDSANLEEEHTARRMAFDNAKATYEQAKQQYDITKSSNESLLSDAALKVRFALLDLKKYLGMVLAEQVIAGSERPSFEGLTDHADLGGEALQQKRKLESDIDLASEELSRAASKVEWTRTLKEKGYVTGSELEADELAVKRCQVNLEQARTALKLFVDYQFLKDAEQCYTNWLESKREYTRVEARAASSLTSAAADLAAKEASFNLEKGRLAKVEIQLAKTIITAPQAGMVVYARRSNRPQQQEIIEIGAAVKHQQSLIRLPDLSTINVVAKLHESVVKQVALGAPAFITIDAWPDRRFTGKVTKIAVMPDQSQLWLNPGLKAYPTSVTLDSTPQGLKPGMSAQVEILVDDRPSVLQVPISAIYVEKGYQAAYVRRPGGGVETRRVEVGLSNNRAVEVLTGLSEGDEVYLYRPPGTPELVVDEKAAPPAPNFANRKGSLPAELAAEAPRPDPAAAEAGNQGRGGGRAMTPERIAAMKKRLETATPEERDRILQRLRDAEKPKPTETAADAGGPAAP